MQLRKKAGCKVDTLDQKQAVCQQNVICKNSFFKTVLLRLKAPAVAIFGVIFLL